MADKISLAQLIELETKSANYNKLEPAQRQQALDKRQKLALVFLKVSKDSKVMTDFVSQGGLTTLLHFLTDDDLTIKKHAIGVLINISYLSTF